MFRTTTAIQYDAGSMASSLGWGYHLFISHSDKNTSIAQKVLVLLQQHGLGVWCDRDTGEHDRGRQPTEHPRGKLLATEDDQIGKRLWEVMALSKVCLVVATKAAYISQWVAREFAYFYSVSRPIVVWHAECDFFTHISYDPRQHALEHTLFYALTGETKIPFIFHLNNGPEDVSKIAATINYYIELQEFIEWKGEVLSHSTVDAYSRAFKAIRKENVQLRKRIYKKWGRKLHITRNHNPSDLMSKNRPGKQLKPWVVKENEHWKRFMEDEDFRQRVLNEVGSGE